MCIDGVCASPETSTCEVPNDIKLTLPADSVCENGIVEGKLTACLMVKLRFRLG